MSTIQNPRKTWLVTGSLLTVWWRMPSLWPRLPHCLPALAVPCLPLCLQQREGLVHCRLAVLCCSLNSFFCERTRLCLIAFCGKVLSLFLFFFFSLAIPQFGLLSHISSLTLSSGHSGLVHTLSMQPMPPCSAPTRFWRTQASRLLLHWELRLGA